MRVLVAEDERLLADAMAEGLRRESLAVDVAYDGAAAQELLRRHEYDVLVLDRDLPLMHGDQVCRMLATTDGRTRVLMVTAAGEVADRVAGLALGADDYLPKPFAFAELVARVRALGRRARQATPPVLHRAGITFDPSRREVLRDGRAVMLSRKELAVLEELLRATGGVLSIDRLLERAWDGHLESSTNVVRMTVMNLRRKLGDPPVIVTVSGVGYQIP